MKNNKKELFNVLKSLYSFRRINFNVFISKILRESKHFRDKNGKDKAKEMGWNIYNKRNIKIQDVLEEAKKEELIKFNKDTIELTKKGIHYVKCVYTNNFSEEYLRYKDYINKEYINMGLPIIDEDIIIQMFYYKLDLKERIEYDKNNRPFIKDMNHLLDLNNIKYSDDDYILFLRPKLFLPIDLINSEVSINIISDISLNIPDNIIILKPYSNKRYFVVGQKYNSEKTAAGFFPLVCKKEEFPNELYLELHWTVNNSIDMYNIVHKINLKFDKTQPFGNVFSTNQQFAYMSDLNKFDLITTIEDGMLNESRNAKIEGMNIIENATLSNFPIEYQGGFY